MELAAPTSVAVVVCSKITHPLRLVFLAAIAFMLSGCSLLGLFARPRGINLTDPERAVVDARKLIEDHRRNPNKLPFYEPGELPESLRISWLRIAYVSEDHIELVLYRDPDLRMGARIWSIDSKREHRDLPTRYPDVFFFRYNNDYPESPDNIP